MSNLTFLPAALATGLFACASSAGTHPHDHSAQEHEALAKAEDEKAALHGTAYDPQAATNRPTCTAASARASGLGSDVCWTRVVNPTAAHRAEMDEHRQLAAAHRAASQALRDAENKACVGLGPDDRDLSPFANGDDIAGVRPWVESAPSGKLHFETTVGAVVTFRAVPGMTAEWLQRVMECHLARNAALGHVDDGMATCPLVPRGVSARVTSSGTGFEVAIRADDPETAKEVLSRAQHLVPAGAR